MVLFKQCARPTSTISAPTASGSSSSSTAMSNESVVTAANRDADVSPGAWRIDSRKLITARCGTRTPFGLPVVPEV